MSRHSDQDDLGAARAVSNLEDQLLDASLLSPPVPTDDAVIEDQVYPNEAAHVIEDNAFQNPLQAAFPAQHPHQSQTNVPLIPQRCTISNKHVLDPSRT